LIDRHAAAMHGARNLGYLYQLLAMSGWTSLPWLWSLPQQTLVLMGRDDPLVTPINGHILAALIPNAELQMIDDGHLFIVTRPAKTAAMIEAFLADASRRVEPSSPLSRTANLVRGLFRRSEDAAMPNRSKKGGNDDGHDLLFREPHERGPCGDTRRHRPKRAT
jgi:hypothetical protein